MELPFSLSRLPPCLPASPKLDWRHPTAGDKFRSPHPHIPTQSPNPTNNALLMNFRLSSDAEILLISTD